MGFAFGGGFTKNPVEEATIDTMLEAIDDIGEVIDAVISRMEELHLRIVMLETEFYEWREGGKGQSDQEKLEAVEGGRLGGGDR